MFSECSCSITTEVIRYYIVIVVIVLVMGLEFLLCMKMDRSNGRIAENEAIFHCHLEANLQKLM